MSIFADKIKKYSIEYRGISFNLIIPLGYFYVLYQNIIIHFDDYNTYYTQI